MSVSALRPRKRNLEITDLAMASGVVESPYEELPSCQFIATPWKETLNRTDGRIMATEEY